MIIEYVISGWIKYSEEDVYDKGCIYIGRDSMVGGSDRFVGKTPEEAINNFLEFFGANKDCLDINACDEVGRVDICLMEDEAGSQADENEIQLWKKNKKRLWYAVYTGYIEVVTRKEFNLQGLKI